MISIAENNLGIDIVTQFSHVDSLDTSYSANGHEYGSGDLTMVGGYLAGAGVGLRGGSFYFEIHRMII